MFGLLLAATMFLPHQVARQYPKPDPACFYEWISDASMIENRCDAPMVIDVAYKNGLGTHTILKKGDVLQMRKPPVKVFFCTAGKGVPSAAPDHYVHPGFKTEGYACLSQELEFPPYAGGR